MKKTLLSAIALMSMPFVGLQAQTLITDSITFTGGITTYTVPCGVTSLTVTCLGAQGGSGANGNSGSGQTLGGVGGFGGLATGVLAVSPGDILNVFVGGAGATPTGGFNGGANGGSQNAGGGGGASDIRVGGTAESNRVITAGGGGGGGRGGCESQVAITGGAGSGGGSGLAGSNGQDAPTSGGAAGGGKGGNFGNVQGAAGAAGVGCGGFLGSPGGTSTTGTGAAGGSGQSCCCFSFGSIPAGGGGGGGQLGGGGGGGGSAGTTGCSGNDKGAGGGGGGGSSYTGGVTSGSSLASQRSGNGAVYIVYADPTPGPVTITGLSSLCVNDNANFFCTTDPNATFYTWTIPSGLTFNSGQNTTTANVTANTPGTYTITCNSASGCGIGPVASFTVTVNALPTIAATSNPSSICMGDAVALMATGASTYTWMPGSLTGASTSDIPTATTNYTVTGTDANGCMSSNTVTVTVNTLPTVGSTVSPSSTVCSGDMVVLTGTGATTYSWSGGVSDAVAFAATATTTYTVTGTDANGCANTNTTTITVNPTPTVTATTANGTICVGENAAIIASGANTYSWMPGSLTGASISVSPSSTTTYTVTGSSTSGCLNTTTVTITVNPCTGLEDVIQPGNLVFSPNPAVDVLHMTWDAGFTVSTVEIYDLAGKLVISKAVKGANADINVAELSSGMYNMTVIVNGNKQAYRFVKN